MRIASRLVCLGAAGLFIAACGGGESAGGADPLSRMSPELRVAVLELDEMLTVPRDEYPNGEAVSYQFEKLFLALSKEKRNLRIDRIQQDMGYYVSEAQSLGWDPDPGAYAAFAQEWRELRARIVGG